MSGSEAAATAASEMLVEQILEFARSRTEVEREQLRRRVREVLTRAGPDQVVRLVERILTTGNEWAYHPPEPLAREVQRTIAHVVLGPGSVLEGAAGLQRLSTVPPGTPLVFVANHLSYSDANLFEILLREAGHGELADRLTVIAGPKVYSDPVRRFSSLCFGTIKTPQSTARSSEEAVMSPREVARVALETIALARERQGAGDVLLLFVEGTRSRTARMQRTLPAVARYFDAPGTLLVPVGIAGSEKLVPVGDEHLQAGDVTVKVGTPGSARAVIEAADGNRRLVMDSVGVAIARLLPEPYRGEYGEDVADLAAARSIAERVFSPA
jgi:1-acyl-sn-glycerol-3-phosphate acyltransferase